jgi:hypothetical protein
MDHKRRWTTNMSRVEIEISTFCNLSCPNCDRSSARAQAPSTESMSIAQLERFVAESIELDWPWQRIVILGGEPTLHPAFDEVVQVLGGFRRHRPDTVFRMYTNGFGRRVQSRIAGMPEWFEVVNTGKDRDNPPLFSAYNTAPVDSADCAHEDFSKGCLITSSCGLGLTRYGYYPCGAGAAIDRVFGYDIGIKKLADVTPERLVEQLRQLCRLCGHFRDFDVRADVVKSENPGALAGWTTESRISPTWQQAYARYAEAPPQLSVY